MVLHKRAIINTLHVQKHTEVREDKLIKMKNQINEIARMQQIAGIITESKAKQLSEAAVDVTGKAYSAGDIIDFKGHKFEYQIGNRGIAVLQHLDKKMQPSPQFFEAGTQQFDAILKGAKIVDAAKKMDEAAFSSNDVSAILKTAKAAVEAGKEVTVDGIKIGKVVPGLGRLVPADGSQSLKIMDYVGTPEKIVIDGVPAELKPYEPKQEPRVDTRTPEEKAKAQRDFNDRYGPGGGYQTGAGFYTGD